MKPAEFLELYYGNMDGGCFSIFHLPGAYSSFHSDPKSAVETIKTASKAGKDVYNSMGLVAAPLKKGRGGAKDVIALTSFHADVDYISGTAHSKKNLPPSKGQAKEFIRSVIPLEPTVLVHSGHGYHAHWIFNEPWYFEVAEDRTYAIIMLKRFFKTFVMHGQQKGWEVDMLSPLTQILRIPGTTNYKRHRENDGPIAYVEAEECSGILYNPDDFEDVILAEEKLDEKDIKKAREAHTTSRSYEVYDVQVDPDVQPDWDLLKETCRLNPKLQDIWDKQLDLELQARAKNKSRTRKEPIEADTSLSFYDWMLAKELGKWGFTPQQIVNVMIAFRRRHKDEPSGGEKGVHKKYVQRTDYVHRTLTSALRDLANSEESESVGDLYAKVVERSNDGTYEEKPDLKEDDKKQARVELKQSLGVPIRTIRKYLSDPPEYEFVTEDDRRVYLGKVVNLLDQNRLRNALFDELNVHLKMRKRNEWNKIASFFNLLIEEVATSAETRESAALQIRINEYVNDKGLHRDAGIAVQGEIPFRKDGKVYIFTRAFKSYLKTSYGEEYTNKDLIMAMEKLGCAINSSMTFPRQADGKRHCRSVIDITSIHKEQHDGTGEHTADTAW